MVLTVDMRAPLPPEALQVNRRRPRSFRLLIFPLYVASCSVISFVAARRRHLREQSRVFLFDLYRSKLRGSSSCQFERRYDLIHYFPLVIVPSVKILSLNGENTRESKGKESRISEKVVACSRRGILFFFSSLRF